MFSLASRTWSNLFPIRSAVSLCSFFLSFFFFSSKAFYQRLTFQTCRVTIDLVSRSTLLERTWALPERVIWAYPIIAGDQADSSLSSYDSWPIPGFRLLNSVNTELNLTRDHRTKIYPRSSFKYPKSKHQTSALNISYHVKKHQNNQVKYPRLIFGSMGSPINFSYELGAASGRMNPNHHQITTNPVKSCPAKKTECFCDFPNSAKKLFFLCTHWSKTIVGIKSGSMSVWLVLEMTTREGCRNLTMCGHSMSRQYYASSWYVRQQLKKGADPRTPPSDARIPPFRLDLECLMVQGNEIVLLTFGTEPTSN